MRASCLIEMNHLMVLQRVMMTVETLCLFLAMYPFRIQKGIATACMSLILLGRLARNIRGIIVSGVVITTANIRHLVEI